MDELARVPAVRRQTDAADLARALGFVHDFARRKAPREIAVPGGFAVLDDRYPGSYDDNKLIVYSRDPLQTPGTPGQGPGSGQAPGTPGHRPGSPGAEPGMSGEVREVAERLLRAADEVLAERAHRLICVDDDRLGIELEPAFAAAGYTHETNLVMAFRGTIPHDPPAAEPLPLAELLPVLRRDWSHTLPQAPEHVIDQLAARVAARLDGAGTVGFRGVRAPDGEIAARADLYAHGGVAQIESVFTSERHRGLGYARSLMRSLLAESAQAELIFLLADADDWPKDFYAGLGFAGLGRTHAFLRT
ncbi:GNAT family N-acetyltransferase [Nonomuraea sp. NPDC002799]